MQEGSHEADADRTMISTSAMYAEAAKSYEPRDHYLHILEGTHAGLRLKLGPRPFVIGRRSDCDLPIADTQVSARHCELSLTPLGPQLVVRDLGSTNGTFVEGERVNGAASLPPGGMMRLGGETIRHEYLLRSEAERDDLHQRDLDKARHYVESLLPQPIAAGPIATDWVYVPSAQLGGDAFGYHQLSEERFCGYLMDVSGHGVGAAMHSVSVMNVMRQRALPDCDFNDPGQVLARLNDMFGMEAHDGMYFSMWYGVYDIARRTLRYASGGHHASYLVDAGRSRMTPLRTRNLVIGAMPGAPFSSSEVEVEPGSTLYVFSDGVFEVVGADGAQKGLPDFLPFLMQPRAVEGSEAKRIESAVRDSARPGPLEDDFTLLTVTFVSSG
ncbi:MAG TPA: SpoIIE family protein phosphatase [Ramlibacter sp.]|uniref:PP2C family protein-serine/threonine phosphatase n=1 Tax=Ramlibacter sp. TaxID=1917967 RepID=UPI002BE2CBB0|nr:SpoIIE family protein phosphatase [Ramlibacter sp.]HVZ45992.1 SpoIIE family protein phosphatase [Ramlibacter sp.]